MIDILMPRLSDTMTEGAIAVWRKKPGDPVTPGDVLLEIETDKALMEQEAYDAGTLVEILVPEGENVAIGTPIARLDDGKEPAPLASSERADLPAPAAPRAPEPDATPPAPPHGRATPLVRRLAKEQGIDLSSLTGSGPGGRIVRADLDAAAEAPASPVPSGEGAESPADITRIPFDGIRRAIATRLSDSAATIPVFHATAAADVTDLLALRTQLNAVGDTRISVNDLVVKAVALALRDHPGINAAYSPDDGGQTVIHHGIHVGVAVAAPSGLVVPVVRDADRSSISTIARRTRELADRAAARTLTVDEMNGGTFTVSNLGMFGVEHFTAIINPPQGAILAVGGITDELALVDEGVVARRRLRVTLTCDHRIIDGAAAGRFLAGLTAALEAPLRVLT